MSEEINRREFFKRLKTDRLTLALGREKVFLPRDCFFWADLKNGFIGFPTGLEDNLCPSQPIMMLIAAVTLLEQGYCAERQGTDELIAALKNGCSSYFLQAINDAASNSVTLETFLRYCICFGLSSPVAGKTKGVFPLSASGSLADYISGSAADLKPSILQLLRIVALIANEGFLPALHSAEEEAEASEVYHLDFSANTWRHLKMAMDNVGDRMQMSAMVPQQSGFISITFGYFPALSPIYAYVASASSLTKENRAENIAETYLSSRQWS